MTKGELKLGLTFTGIAVVLLLLWMAFNKPVEESELVEATHATAVTKPKRVGTYKMGDDALPEWHLIYEFEVDGTKYYYGDVYREGR